MPSKATCFPARLGSGNALLTGLSIQQGRRSVDSAKVEFRAASSALRGRRLKSHGRTVIPRRLWHQLQPGRDRHLRQRLSQPRPHRFAELRHSDPRIAKPGYRVCDADELHSLFGYPPNPNVKAIGATAFAPNGLPTTPGAIGIQAFPSTLPTTYVYHYSLDMQQDVGFRTVLTVGYSGQPGPAYLLPLRSECRSVRA